MRRPLDYPLASSQSVSDLRALGKSGWPWPVTEVLISTSSASRRRTRETGL